MVSYLSMLLVLCLLSVAIQQATVDEAEWLIHIDLDELMFPAGSSSFTLQQYFASLQSNVRSNNHSVIRSWHSIHTDNMLSFS